MKHKIYGNFSKKNGFIYRTETYIQIGESKDIIGSCVLCNPGSAKLHDPIEQKKLEDYEENYDYPSRMRATEDDTMKQLIKIIKGSGLYEDGGRFLIHNLFTLRNSNMTEALIQMKDPNIDRNLLYKDYVDYINIQKEIPWTIIGWGCENNAALKGKKNEWLEYINENKVINIGYKHKNMPHYYHPLPRGHSKRKNYVEIMVDQLNNLLAEARG